MEKIDNFLDDSSFKLIKTLLLSEEFPWYYTDSKLLEATDSLYDFQFTHMFYNKHSPRSGYIDIINPLIDKLNPSAIIRIKANLTSKTPENMDFGMHVDYNNEKSKTAIYYVNTNNGYTLFENGEKIDSLENRLIKFDSSEKHSGFTSTDTKVRCVLNINYYE